MALLCSIWAQADNVLKVNGEEVAKDFTTMTIDMKIPGNLLVHFTDGTVVSYNMNLIEVLPNEISAIDTPSSPFFKVSRHVKDVLTIEGITAGTSVAIYAANGAQVLKDKAAGESYTANLSELPKGVYVLNVGRQSVKFVKD